MLVQIEGKDSDNVVRALVRQVKCLPDGVMSSLTWDRGTELAHHKRFTIATDVNVYFCDPQSPWQRGSSENTNGLLRQYLPKGSDLSAYSQADLDAVALRLNTRPRKTLGFVTPAAKFAAGVALTLEPTTLNFAASNAADSTACRLDPSSTTFIHFYANDPGMPFTRWATFMAEAARLGRAGVHIHYGREAQYIYAVGTSNGGYQVRRAVEFIRSCSMAVSIGKAHSWIRTCRTS